MTRHTQRLMRRALKSLEIALPPGLLEQPAPPCEQYRCDRFEDCKTQLLACEAFRYYVEEGLVVAPGTVLDAQGKPHTQSPVPTRAKYWAIYRKGGT